jgi:hypothetical protein
MKLGSIMVKSMVISGLLKPQTTAIQRLLVFQEKTVQEPNVILDMPDM